MRFEINVTLNGVHLFATHPRSLNTPLADKAEQMVKLFREKFPAEEGYNVQLRKIVETITEWEV